MRDARADGKSDPKRRQPILYSGWLQTRLTKGTREFHQLDWLISPTKLMGHICSSDFSVRSFPKKNQKFLA
jgi:hypothetical protein